MNQQVPTGSESLLAVSKIQEQLRTLNSKMDIIINKISQMSGSSAPKLNNTPQTSYNKPAHVSSNDKPMYQIICADCKKESSLPFRPAADRPAYCKECFSRRRNGSNSNLVQITPVNVPKAVSAAPAPAVGGSKKSATKKAAVKPAVGGSKKVPAKSAVKKTTPKKKPVTKKKK